MEKSILNKKIGLRIIEIRTAKCISQSNLARACNKDRQAIEKLEKGKVNPTIFTLFQICDALNISLSDFLNFDSNL